MIPNQTLCVVDDNPDLESTWKSLSTLRSDNFKVVREEFVKPETVKDCLKNSETYMWSGHGSGIRHF